MDSLKKIDSFPFNTGSRTQSPQSQECDHLTVLLMMSFLNLCLLAVGFMLLTSSDMWPTTIA